MVTMRNLLVLLALFVVGCQEACTSSEIDSCSYGCHRSNLRMRSYSRANGCACE